LAKIFINPGHAPNGNPDPGAVGQTGLRESDVAAEVGEIVSGYLKAVGYETMVYQSDSLQDICDKANTYGADLFISIHCNSFSNPNAKGMEVWTSRGETNADRLATRIIKQMEEEFPALHVRTDLSDGDPDKESGFYVLNGTDAPAVLVELAFISNPQEEELLASFEGKRMFAAAIARGVTDYWAAIN
jgi:N-acetylmuramoyl-L-alanine amidase